MKTSKENTLIIDTVTKKYDRLTAVNAVSFSAAKGDIIALLGPNGAGKSTLMNMIAGYISPDSGNISVLQKNIRQFPLFAKENIGFLPEGSPLYADLSVKNFLQYMAELRSLNKTAVLKAAQVANIENVMAQKIETLSKGYQRRVGFAQSILHNPPILLLDEPTDGLDPNQKDYMRKLIKDLAKDKTIIISTHLLEEAENVCNRIIVLNQGQIVAQGSLAEILQQTDTKNMAQAFAKLTNKEKNHE